MCLQKIFEIDIFRSDSESALQNTAHKTVYEIDFEKIPKTGPPYGDNRPSKFETEEATPPQLRKNALENVVKFFFVQRRHFQN